MKSLPKLPKLLAALLSLVLTATGQTGLVNGKGGGITDPAAFRTALQAQSSRVGFLDDFGRSDRYAEGATITANTSTPLIGGYAYRVRQLGATTPTVTTGALKPTSDTLYYLQNRAPTPGGGSFSMGMVLELERSSVYLTALNNGGGNFSIYSAPMVDDAGGIGELATQSPIHINWSNEGVTAATLYPSTSLTCLNRTLTGGALRWDPDGKFLPLGEKFTLLVRVTGDVIEVEAVGLGTVMLTHPDVSTKIGTDYTYFWHEPNGELLGTDYRHVARLHRWWAQADELNTMPGYGLTSALPSGHVRIASQLRLYPEGSKSPLSANTPAGATSAVMRIAARGTTAKGSYSRFTGGHVISEGLISHDFGHSNVGAMFEGFMVASLDSNLNAAVSSTAGAANSPNIGNNLWVHGLENGDWETVFLAGSLVGAGNKRIRISTDSAPFGAGNSRMLADSNVTATPLNGTTGFWTAEIKRYTNSGSGMVFYTELKANGVLIDATRQVLSLRDSLVYYGVECTTADAGGVVIDTHIRRISRVNPLNN